MTHKTNNMKLYTEEQVRKLLKYLTLSSPSVDGYMDRLTPIELPSDEEIVEYSPAISKNAEIYLVANKIGFVHGAKWMKKEILKQTK